MRGQLHVIGLQGRANVQRHAPNASAQAEAAGRLRIAKELQKALRRTAVKTATCQSRIEELETAGPATEGEEAELRQACKQLAAQISSSQLAVEAARKGKIEVSFHHQPCKRIMTFTCVNMARSIGSKPDRKKNGHRRCCKPAACTDLSGCTRRPLRGPTSSCAILRKWTQSWPRHCRSVLLSMISFSRLMQMGSSRVRWNIFH